MPEERVFLRFTVVLNIVISFSVKKKHIKFLYGLNYIDFCINQTLQPPLG